MKARLAVLAVLLSLLPASQAAGLAGEDGGGIPSWIKNNAGWWSEGRIGDDVFVQGIRFLMEEQIIDIPPVRAEAGSAAGGQQGIPDWVKTTAGWWAAGQVGDSDFIGGIQHLVRIGIIDVGDGAAGPGGGGAQDGAGDAEIRSLRAELDACGGIARAYERLECEDGAKTAIMVYEYKRDVRPVQVGPVSYYWKGIGSDGNAFEISSAGQALLSIRMLAENTGSERVALNCTSPQICSYDVTDGTSEFKYAGMDFTNGQIVLNPGAAKEFNMLFGPNIGYGGTQFVYDPAKEYHFRISEEFGTARIPLGIG